MDVLEEQFISQANARQRRGRAGRVRTGVCYHLACKFTVDTLPAFTVPEMLRMSLEDLVLQVRPLSCSALSPIVSLNDRDAFVACVDIGTGSW